MRVSRFFLPILKETPSEAQIASHRLMLRAGMIDQLTSGIYSWLPLGLRVLKKIENIIRDEMNKAGCVELLMPLVQPAEIWQESGRYDAYGKEMLRFQDRHERDMLFGPTHEEVVTTIFKRHVKSYRDLPKSLYQINWKFRDEIRPRFGVMRAREFLMKDAYSFDLNYESARKTYDAMYKAYLETFARLGVHAIPVRAETGAIGGNLSHEFHIIAETGESAIYYDEAFDDVRSGKRDVSLEEMQNFYAAADDLHKPDDCPVPQGSLKEARGIEVGHVFYLGNKYSNALGAKITNKAGELQDVEMGCYGIGVSRLVGAIIEACHDDNGIIWPEAVAPFRVALINLKVGDPKCDELCDTIYRTFEEKGVEILYHDGEESPGAKFATMDLIGIPWQVIVGPRGVASGMVEIKNRKTDGRREVSIESLLKNYDKF